MAGAFKETATEYGDLHRLARTADAMGQSAAAEGYRERAEEVRQDFFGPDSQFGQ